MQIEEITISECSSTKLERNHVDILVLPPEWLLKLRIETKKHRWPETIEVRIIIDLHCRVEHTEGSMATTTSYIFRSVDFEASIFFKEHFTTLLNMVEAAYNHTRAFFVDRSEHVGKMSIAMLPFKSSEDIKRWIVTQDVYNQL